ncbi:MAG TPA: 7-carboxy-7-deazaguanine synthase QueE [Deltaproteobacteria bacterium]|nr:7-carboxy-7-deazaguanine synthase QueE [Deltaproteobacteria bacterium]
MKLVITEIFHSLQGEGPMLGTPSIFIRLGGCIEPLCPWCDTPYAWHEFREMGIDEILLEVGRYPGRDVVITGGEPFLQWESGLKGLHDALVNRGYRLCYETSGKAGIPEVQGAAIVLSPKHIDGSWHCSAQALQRADCYKFVADDLPSLREIDAFVRVHALDAERVFIMPMGATREEQLQRMETVFAFCRDHGYHMTPRLHVLVFGQRRGV